MVSATLKLLIITNDFLAERCELIVSDKQPTTTTYCLLTPLPCPWHWSIAVGARCLKEMVGIIFYFLVFVFAVPKTSLP